MIKIVFNTPRRLWALSLLFLTLLVPAHAGVISTPEPSSYALGFGAAALGFVVWRNRRRARGRNRKGD